MITRKRAITICIAVGLLGFGILINGLFNKSVPKNEIEEQITTETGTSSTTSTATTKTSKKVVKTTKKATKKKTNSKIHIKYNRKEIENYVYQEVVRRWGEEHWIATYNIISYESGFNPNSWNEKNTACGLFQAKPCKKTIKNGYKDYYTNWKTQVIWGLDYISYKYGNPNNAWKYWQKHHSF